MTLFVPDGQNTGALLELKKVQLDESVDPKIY